MNCNAMLFEKPARPLGGRLASEARPEMLALDQQIDLEAHLGERGRQFDAEQSGADHDDAAATAGRRASVGMSAALGFRLIDRILQAFEIVKRAQVMQARQVMSRNGQVPRKRAGGEKEVIEGDLVAIVERHRLTRSIKMRRPAAGAQLDTVLFEPTGRLGEEGGARLTVAQPLFGERRTMVGTRRFLGDQENFPFTIPLANRLGSGAARHPAANQKVFHVVFSHGTDNNSRSLYIVGGYEVQGGKLVGLASGGILTKRHSRITIYPDQRMVKIASQPDALLAWMDCLADPMRLRLLRILERHGLGWADLCDGLQTPQSTVIRHLKLLLE